jgi:hypothetical protein
VTSSSVLRLSWSRVRNHDECPAKGDLLRRHKSPAQDIRNFVHGNVVDLAMRRWLNMEDPEPGWMAARIDEIFTECTEHSDEGFVHWKTPTDRAETREFCRELVTRLEPILARYALPFLYRPAVRFEQPVSVPYLDGSMREILLIGEMDLLVEDSKGRIAVWDLKGTRDNSYYKKVQGQLTFYAFAVKLKKNRYPAMTGLIQPMCDQQVLPLPVAVSPDALAQMAGRITKTAQDIWAGRLAPKDDRSDCTGPFGCPVQHACPAFKVGRTSRSPAAA